MKFAVALSLLAAPALADTIAVQGALTNLGGPVDGVYAMTLRLFDSASATQPLFQEIEVGVPVVEGVFSTLLGDGVSLTVDALDTTELWVEIAVANDPPLQRVRLSSVARAFVAERSHDLSCSGCVTPEETSFMACPDESILVRTGGAWSCSDRPSGKDFALSNQLCPVGQVLRGFKTDGTSFCTPDNDTTYSGANFAVSGSGCPSGQVMTGVGADGLPTCAPDKDTTYSGANFALSGQACPAGEFVRSIDSSGKPVCATDKDTTYTGANFALSNKSCASGQVVRGIDVNGNPVCEANPTYSGANFALSNQTCTAGQVVRGFDANGNVVCEANPTYSGANFALSNKSCGAGQVQKGVDASGNPVCVADANTTYNGGDFATSNQTCGAGQYVSGINASGQVVCSNLKTYINANCYVYFGWLDSCDACTTAPTKSGYANGVATGAGSICSATGTDSNCLTTTLNGASVRMVGINTDGDVNGDDKFYIGFRCD